MRRVWAPVVLWMAAFFFATCPGSALDRVPNQNVSSEEFRIGLMVKAIQAALRAPEELGSLTVVVEYGRDSRYYVMIRGWLVQELQGTESQLASNRDGEARIRLTTKTEFLKKAIRMIDLE